VNQVMRSLGENLARTVLGGQEPDGALPGSEGPDPAVFGSVPRRGSAAERLDKTAATAAEGDK
jgi:hypothetical protein